MKRVAVVGAGPAGSAAAIALQERLGVQAILIERAALPRTKVCGSGLSPWTLHYLDAIGIGREVRKHAYRIDGARIGGIEGDGVELRGDHETAILRRSEFDYLLTKEAVRRGAQLRDGVKVENIVHERDAVMGLETSDGPIEVDAVIDASGAKGKLDGMTRPGPTLHTIMGWYTGVEQTSDIVELFFDASVKPHYGWIFPETDERVNIGICFDPTRGEGNARERFDRFVDARLAKRLRRAELQGKLVGHPVHTSAVPRDLVGEGVLIAGEAGRLVDEATAEGIYHGLVSGTLAGRFMTSVLLAGGRPTRDRLSPYLGLVRRALLPRLTGGRILMEALRTPVLDFALRFQEQSATRFVLRRMFAGLYHG